MSSLECCVSGFLRKAHLDGMCLGALAVLIALRDAEHSRDELCVITGYHVEGLRKHLQRLRFMGEVEFAEFRAARHGQIEYRYKLTDKGAGLVEGLLCHLSAAGSGTGESGENGRGMRAGRKRAESDGAMDDLL